MSSLCIIIIIKKNENKAKCWKTELSYTVAEHKTSLTDPFKRYCQSVRVALE